MGLLKVFFTDPYFKTRWPDGELHKPPIHANYNDGMATEMNSPRLGGRTDEGVGPMQEIEVISPLVFEDETLSIDLSATQAQLDALDVRIDTLEATALSHLSSIGTNTTNIAANTTAIGVNTTNITANANAITALAARVTTIETRIPTPLQNFASDAAAASGGIAVGRFYRNGSVVQIRVT